MFVQSSDVVHIFREVLGLNPQCLKSFVEGAGVYVLLVLPTRLDERIGLSLVLSFGLALGLTQGLRVRSVLVLVLVLV
jgi:hypothetical protein